MEYLVVDYIEWKILGYNSEFKKLRKMLACPSGSLSSENKWKKLSSMCVTKLFNFLRPAPSTSSLSPPRCQSKNEGGTQSPTKFLAYRHSCVAVPFKIMGPRNQLNCVL